MKTELANRKLNHCICVAGVDSSKGAGLDADQKALAVFDIEAVKIVTAQVLQDAGGLKGIEATDSEMISSDLLDAINKYPNAPIKIGMLPNALVIEAVAKVLQDQNKTVVVDPVMGPSTSGRWADESWLLAFKKYMPSVASVLVPNLDEARVLVDLPKASAKDCSNALQGLGFKTLVITGGEQQTDQSEDFVLDHNNKSYWLIAKRIKKEARGTGCTHSSSICAALIQNLDLASAFVFAKMQVACYIANECHKQSDMSYLPTISDSTLSKLSFKKLTRAVGICPIVASCKQLEDAISSGIHSAQIRIKDLSCDKLKEELAKASTLAKDKNIDLFVNDYWQLCLELEVKPYGIHLGQEDIASADLAAIHLAGLRLGVSAHNLFETAIAASYQPSYISFGPVFETSSKKITHEPLQVEGLTKLCDQLDFAAMAIGGISLLSIEAIKKTKLSGVAVMKAAEKKQDLLDLVQAWEKSKDN